MYFHAIGNLIPPSWAGSLTAETFHLATEPYYISKDKEAAIEGFLTTAEESWRWGIGRRKKKRLHPAALNLRVNAHMHR